jgi:hypothetical protein
MSDVVTQWFGKTLRQELVGQSSIHQQFSGRRYDCKLFYGFNYTLFIVLGHRLSDCFGSTVVHFWLDSTFYDQSLPQNCPLHSVRSLLGFNSLHICCRLPERNVRDVDSDQKCSWVSVYFSNVYALFSLHAYGLYVSKIYVNPFGRLSPYLLGLIMPFCFARNFPKKLTAVSVVAN